MSRATKCPSCQALMTSQELASLAGGVVELDLCFQCRGIWFDPQENLKLAPSAVVELFGLLHAHRDDACLPLASKMDCPRCSGALAQGFDVVRSGRYVTYRCTQRHGRFSLFSAFMVEKGFVRQLTRPEIDDIAQRMAVIHCASCGAAVDIRKDAACPYCHCAFSLLDPQAVELALKGYQAAAKGPVQIKPPEFADALMMVEHDRLKAERDAKAQRSSFFAAQEPASGDLWVAGLEMVWKLLK